jgi:hypothetical protein
MKSLILVAVSSGALLCAQAQKTFDTPEQAARALMDAAATNNTGELNAIFGPQGKSILTTGDESRDKAERQTFASIAKSKYSLQRDSMDSNRMILSVGEEDWPFPAPIVKKDGKWRFDASMGAQAMKAREIGANELDAIEICSGVVAAEQTYAERNPTHTYSATLAALEPDVPRAFAMATGSTAMPYHGYYFALLKSQGANASGGRANYLIKGTMLGGFGLVAWPAQYRESGVHTFIVNQDGVVYEKDLGAHANPPVTAFNPDSTWRVVN